MEVQTQSRLERDLRRAIERVGDTYDLYPYWGMCALSLVKRVDASDERMRLRRCIQTYVATNVIDIEKLRALSTCYGMLTDEFNKLLETETDALKEYAFFHDTGIRRLGFEQPRSIRG